MGSANRLSQLGSASRVPDILGPTSPSNSDCGGCYVVADVAGVFWGTETVTYTSVAATVSIAFTPNGTNVTTTITAKVTPFTAYPTGLASDAANFGTDLDYNGPTLAIGGVQLYELLKIVECRDL